MESRKIIIIVGPTCSGKSKFSIKMAKKLNGEIINSDGLQCYHDLSILSFIPSEDERGDVKHHLYGVLDYNEPMDATTWAKLASETIESIFSEKKTPIIVGGTGLYIKILFNGISEIPHIPAEIRHATAEFSKRNYPQLCEDVYKFDPEIKNIITPDKHRQMLRAHEIMIKTGRSILYYFNAKKNEFIQNTNPEYIFLNPDRWQLYDRINTRFDLMIKNGAINQVSELLKKTKQRSDFSIFNTIGAKQISMYINGICGFYEMIEKSKQLSRNYAKRQITWIKNQIEAKIELNQYDY